MKEFLQLAIFERILRKFLLIGVKIAKINPAKNSSVKLFFLKVP